MIQKLLLVITNIMIINCCHSQSVYERQINDISGNAMKMKSFFGSKVFFIIAPLSATDSLKLQQLHTLQANYGTTIKLIGIVSREDGFIDGSQSALKKLYEQYEIAITLTEPVYTRKTTSLQSSLMQWLTNRSLNFRSDQDVKGIGQVFYITEGGSLSAVIPPGASLASSGLATILNRTTPSL